MSIIRGLFFPYRLRNLTRRIIFRFTVAPFFGSFGAGSAVLRPVGIEGINRIHIGNGVHVADAALLAAVPHTGASTCVLQIGDRCSFGRNNHIYATSSIVFEPEVLTANNVYVSDNAHSYRDIHRPIMHQGVTQLRCVRIGRGTWLGQNVCVIGASIGRGCVIGANSVVLADIPDYCVAVGAPARVVRRFDPASADWTKVATGPTPPYGETG
ncbi:MAG: acyltransferase [Rhodocyclaceae bacterium]|nr:acyltransferase [Rhodocyclaceae bacterium]